MNQDKSLDTEDQPGTLAEMLEELRHLVDRIATVKFDPWRPYVACLQFSCCRAFEFVKLASQQEADHAFFLTPALRPIAEDVIFFRFLSNCPEEDREMVVRHLMALDVGEKLSYQERFFHTFRPFQGVVNTSLLTKERTEELKDELSKFWRSNGWPNLRKTTLTPPIREMAQKSDPGLLEIVYDFIYRLASGEVHSSPRGLLRLAWGEPQSSDEPPLESRFSTRNLGLYHHKVIQIYGIYLLSLWFELFGEELSIDDQEHVALARLRRHILQDLRWPEMVTFEEMNWPIPEPSSVLVVASATMHMEIMEQGFLAGARRLRDLEEGKQGTLTTEGIRK